MYTHKVCVYIYICMYVYMCCVCMCVYSSSYQPFCLFFLLTHTWGTQHLPPSKKVLFQKGVKIAHNSNSVTGEIGALAFPAYQEGIGIQLYQRLSHTGNCLPQRKVEDVNHKKHIVSRILNKSAIIIFIGYQIVNFGRLVQNLKQIKNIVKFNLSKNYLDGAVLTKAKCTNKNGSQHFSHKHLMSN